MMASYYTRSKVPWTSEIAPSECSDVEPSDAAPSAAATSPLPLSTTVRPTAADTEESESIATEPAEPVSAHPSPAGRPTSLGGPGVEGPEDSSLVGVSTPGYPSGQAGPSEIGARGDVQFSPYSLATGIAETHAQLEASSSFSLRAVAHRRHRDGCRPRPYTCCRRPRRGMLLLLCLILNVKLLCEVAVVKRTTDYSTPNTEHIIVMSVYVRFYG